MEGLRRKNIEEGAKAQQQNSLQLVFEELRPAVDWSQDPISHFLSIDLPGFKKEDIMVKVDRSGKLTVEGKRMTPVDSKYYRVEQVFNVPEDANIDEISGKLDEGRLKLTMMKKGIKETTDVRSTAEQSMLPNKEDNDGKRGESLPEFIAGVGEEVFKEDGNNGMMERFIEKVQRNREMTAVAAVAAVAFAVGFYVSRKLR